MDGGEAAEKRLATKKRSLADDSDDSDAEDGGDEEAGAPSRKRVMLGAASQASGRTGASSRYVAGGRGIHRPTGGAASVRSGVSVATTAARSSGAPSQAGSKAFGGAFKAKKAGGDLKKGKLDPYAYIPLSRTSMNKR